MGSIVSEEMICMYKFYVINNTEQFGDLATNGRHEHVSATATPLLGFLDSPTTTKRREEGQAFQRDCLIIHTCILGAILR